jgi:hypothetical protein
MSHPLTRALAAAAALIALPVLSHAQQFTATKVDIGGEGNFDYLSVDTATGRVFVSRGTRIQVVDATGKPAGEVPNTPGTHGALIVNSAKHGFTTNGRDSTSTMFDLASLNIIKQIHAGQRGLDGFMYDDATNRVVTIDHSPETPPTPGTLVIIDPNSGDVVGTANTSGSAPEGGVSDGKGRIFINLEDTDAMDVIDTKTWKVVATWPVAPCKGPSGIAMDRTSNRIFVGCSNTSVVLDASSGKVVAQITNGGNVDGIAWDQSQKLLYIPSGADGNVTVVHEDSPDKYTTVATVATMKGARTITVDPKTHTAYVFTPEYGPAPAPAPGSPPPTGRGRGPRGPQIGAWLFAIKH